jgi:hypothetical protein
MILASVKPNKRRSCSQPDALAGGLRQPPLRTHVGQPDKDRRNA